MNSTHHFSIAEHMICITFLSDSPEDNITLLPSFEPFATKQGADRSFFTLVVDNKISRFNDAQLSFITESDTGNGIITVGQTEKKIYQFIIRDNRNNECCLLQVNKDFSEAKCSVYGNTGMKKFGLNDALMIMYAFRGSFFNTLLMHASVVENNGYGYAFIAKSGVGKSTHSKLWLENIEGSTLLNDDNPIVRVTGDNAYIYGSPWSGKTPCYKQRKAKLGAIVKIVREEYNEINKCLPYVAFGNILSACSNLRNDKTISHNTSDNVIRLVEVMPYNYILKCLPNKEAAMVCHTKVARG